MTHRVTLIPGDGTGPEIMAATRRAIEATGVADRLGRPAGRRLRDRARGHAAARPASSTRSSGTGSRSKGRSPRRSGAGSRSVNVALRKELDLYANLRPCKTYRGVRTRHDNVDLVVVRESTEDLYVGLELGYDDPRTVDLIAKLESLGSKPLPPKSSVCLKAISVEGSRRIVTFALEYARANRRRKVTIVHKANIMKLTDGLFLRMGQEVARAYPDVEVNDVIVDNMCMQLVQKPELYDVLVMPNLYGDILSDLCAGLVGGLGVVPGANCGELGAVFEPIHGSAPKYAGQNKVNPTAAMLSA